MQFLKKLAGIIGFLLFLAPCVIAGMYAGSLNTSSTLAGWAVGLGVAIIEGCIITLLGSAKTQKNLLLAAVAVAVGAAPSAYFIALPLRSLGPFKAHLAEYMATASAEPDQYLPATEMPVKGRLLPVDMKTKKIDPVFFDLSSDLRPRNPEEIGAVAALWWTEVRVGHYGASGGGAYKHQCTVMVFDKSSHVLLARKAFTGSDPPSTSRNGASQTGSKPYQEIRDYLNNLPHR